MTVGELTCATVRPHCWCCGRLAFKARFPGRLRAEGPLAVVQCRMVSVDLRSLLPVSRPPRPWAWDTCGASAGPGTCELTREAFSRFERGVSPWGRLTWHVGAWWPI
eukprot:1808582-Prymnesium_polylepis.1